MSKTVELIKAIENADVTGVQTILANISKSELDAIVKVGDEKELVDMSVAVAAVDLNIDIEAKKKIIIALLEKEVDFKATAMLRGFEPEFQNFVPYNMANQEIKDVIDAFYSHDASEVLTTGDSNNTMENVAE